MSNVTCNQCGWVHFQVSREYAEKQSIEFASWFAKQPADTRSGFWKFGTPLADVPEQLPWDGKVNPSYERCAGCGGSYKNFREAKDKDSSDGCTLNPIINRQE